MSWLHSSIHTFINRKPLNLCDEILEASSVTWYKSFGEGINDCVQKSKIMEDIDKGIVETTVYCEGLKEW